MAKGEPSVGTILECRVARLYNRQGSFVRRRVDLTRRYSLDKRTITDIDVLAIDFGLDLRATRTIVECKAGSSFKELDRMLWLAGLMKLSSAGRAALFVSGHVPGRSRQVGRELDVLLQDAADLERREVSLKIDREPEWGSHQPELVAKEDDVRRSARSVSEAERAYWFLRSEFWHLTPSLGIKRSIALIDTLSRLHVSGLQTKETATLEWLLADAVVAFAIAAVELAGSALVLPRDAFRRFMVERLAEGVASYSQLERLSTEVDKYVLSILEQAGVSRTKSVTALGVLAPRPPAYAEALTEVVERLTERPRAARHLALVVDFVLAATIRRSPPGSIDGLAVLPVDNIGETLALARLCSAFLKGQARLAPEVARAIDDASPNDRGRPDETTPGDLAPADTGSKAEASVEVHSRTSRASASLNPEEAALPVARERDVGRELDGGGAVAHSGRSGTVEEALPLELEATGE